MRGVTWLIHAWATRDDAEPHGRGEWARNHKHRSEMRKRAEAEAMARFLARTEGWFCRVYRIDVSGKARPRLAFEVYPMGDGSKLMVDRRVY